MSALLILRRTSYRLSKAEWRLMWSLAAEGSAVLAAVQDASRRLRRCPQAGILDSVCARRSAGRQVGTKGWPFSRTKGLDDHAAANCGVL
jgi:hypothetical protein